jgi:hypothetical protein
LELGFMEGRNDDAHLDRLAKIAAAAVLEAFTGETTTVLSVPMPGPRPMPEPLVTPTPSPTTSRLRSSLFARDATLEPVAEGHQVLRSGAMRVDGVGLAQDALNRLAGLGGNYRIDLGSSQQFRGFFGPKTEHAVRTFEADFRLTTNGIVDVETILALDDALAKSERGLNPLPIVSPATQQNGYVPPAASAALLSGLDFSKGTGEMGKRYRAAYAAADADPRLAKGDPSAARVAGRVSYTSRFKVNPPTVTCSIL